MRRNRAGHRRALVPVRQHTPFAPFHGLGMLKAMGLRGHPNRRNRHHAWEHALAAGMERRQMQAQMFPGMAQNPAMRHMHNPYHGRGFGAHGYPRMPFSSRQGYGPMMGGFGRQPFRSPMDVYRPRPSPYRRRSMGFAHPRAPYGYAGFPPPSRSSYQPRHRGRSSWSPPHQQGYNYLDGEDEYSDDGFDFDSTAASRWSGEEDLYSTLGQSSWGHPYQNYTDYDDESHFESGGYDPYDLEDDDDDDDQFDDSFSYRYGGSHGRRRGYYR